MKLLILPSWYPNQKSKSQGIFFSKQAGLVSDTFDTRVFIAREEIRGYKYAVKKFRDFTLKSFKTSDFYLINHSNVVLHQFQFNNFTFLTEKRRQQRLIEIYLKYFEKQILAVWKPDLVHAHDVFNGGIVARAIKRKFGIPYVLTSHNPMNFHHWSRAKFAMFQQTILDADFVITVSDYDKRIMLNAVSDEVKSITLGNYIDEKIFKLKPQARSFPVTMLFVASSSRRKDFPTLISALRLVHENIRESFVMNLVISNVNDGITVTDIQNLIDENGLSKQIRIRSGISFDELQNLYAQTDLYVSSSYLETFGVTVAEAMCCGITVIAADNGGVRDIIQPGINGVIVGMQDPEALATEIKRFINGKINLDPVLIRESIISRYGTEKYLANLEAIYIQAIK